MNQMLARIDHQQQQIDELRGVLCLEDPVLDTTAGPSHLKSSVGDSEVPAHDARRMIDGGPGYPVDGIKDSISCELHQKLKNISMKVAVGYALPCPPDARWQDREIPASYAKVGVDEIVSGFHDMELDIPGPKDERTLGEVVGDIILWDKNYIKLPGSAPRTTPPPSRRRSPTPPSPPRSPPHDLGRPDLGRPSRSPPPDLGRPSSPPPLPAKDKKRSRAPSMSTNRRSSPKRQMTPLPRVPHKNLPIRTYDRTDEEIAATAKAELDAHFAKKIPKPAPVYTEMQKAFAQDFLNTKSQYELHHKPDDYLRTLQKEVEKSKSSKSASGGESSKSASVKRRDVSQLGEQAKQSIPPLNVLSEDVPQVLQQDMEQAAKLAAAMGVTVAELLGSQDDKLPKADVVPTYVPGKPLVSNEKLEQLPTEMRNLHQWYLSEVGKGRTMIVAKVPHEYFFRPEEVHVDFSEIFQLYNFDALDKTLMSCYCL